jgi:hypothetical protein
MRMWGHFRHFASPMHASMQIRRATSTKVANALLCSFVRGKSAEAILKVPFEGATFLRWQMIKYPSSSTRMATSRKTVEG